MSFVFNALVAIRAFGENSIFGYATNDTKATVQGAGYFNNASGQLRLGDIIVVSGDKDGTPFHTSYTVSSNSGGVVALTEHAAVTQNVLQEITLPKISTKASDAEVFRYVANFAGSITKFRSVLNAVLATADATLQLKINATNVTNGLITITNSGSAAGDVDVATPTALNTFVAGDVISVTCAGGSTATGTANCSLQLTPS